MFASRRLAINPWLLLRRRGVCTATVICYSKWHITGCQDRSRRSSPPPRPSRRGDPSRHRGRRSQARRPPTTSPAPSSRDGRQHQHSVPRVTCPTRRRAARNAPPTRHPRDRHTGTERGSQQGRRTRATRAPAGLHPRRPASDDHRRDIGSVGLTLSTPLTRDCRSVEAVAQRLPGSGSSIEPGAGALMLAALGAPAGLRRGPFRPLRWLSGGGRAW